MAVERKVLMLACFLCAATLFVFTGEARGQNMDEILACRAVDNEAERLACFDRTTTPTADSIAAATTPDEGDGRQSLAQASNDGASLIDDSFGAKDLQQRRSKKEKKKKDESDEQLRAKLVGLRFTNSGRYIITLDNGQVWRQIRGDTETLRFPRITGDGVPIIIKEALFGSYRLRTEASKRTIRVERIK